MVGPEGVLVEMNRKALRRLTNNDRLHARPNRTAAISLGDAIAFDQTPLSLSRAATVTAHRRHDEGLRPECLEMLDRRLDDQRDVRHAAAAGGDSHGLIRLDLLTQVQ